MTGSENRSPRRRSPDELYTVLSNIRRRYVIYYAKEVGLPVLFDELVEQIAIWENHHDAEDITRSQRKSVHNALRQTHLPKLEQAGLINHDTESDIITLTDEAERVKLYPAAETSVWRLVYGLLSVVVVVFVGLDRLGTMLDSGVASIPWVEGLLFAFVLLTIGHNYDRYRRRRQVRDRGPDIIVEEIDDREGRDEERSSSVAASTQ